MVVGNFENTVYLMMDEKLRPLPQDPRIADYAGRIEAKFGEHVLRAQQGRPGLHPRRACCSSRSAAASQEKIYFPGRLPGRGKAG